MRRRAHVLVVVALAGCSTPTGPGDGAGDTDAALIVPAFAAADRNGDRVVSPEEWAADGAALFDRLDRNRDQAIDAVDLRASFEVLDSDGDGAIEREEAVDLVERGDADADGRLSPAEFEQLDWARLSADLNRDGRITRDEFYASREQLFLAADRNRDRRLGDREIDPVRFTVFRF